MAKAYKVELLVLDGLNDEVGEGEIVYLLENLKYVFPSVMSIKSKDIGEWSDDHPLNSPHTRKEYYQNLFN